MRYNKFKWGHYASEVIFWYINWFGERSKDDLEIRELTDYHDISISKLTSYRWSMKRTPSPYRNLRGYLLFRVEFSWSLYENYINVKGKWYYLYRAVHQNGAALNFHFSHERNKNRTHQFLKRFLSYYDPHHQDESLSYNKHAQNKKKTTCLIKDGGVPSNVNKVLTLFGIDILNYK